MEQAFGVELNLKYRKRGEIKKFIAAMKK